MGWNGWRMDSVVIVSGRRPRRPSSMDDRPPFTLVDALRHRYRVILGVAAVFCLAAGLLSFVLPKTYQATAIMYLDTARTATDFDAAIAAGDLLQHDFIVSANSRPTLQKTCPSAPPHCSPHHLSAPPTPTPTLL